MPILCSKSDDKTQCLFQDDPPYTRQSYFHKLSGWTDTIEGYINEANQTAYAIIQNARTFGIVYTWFVTINFHDEQTPEQIQKRWGMIRKAMAKRGMIAFRIIEVCRNNLVHYHLIFTSHGELTENKLRSQIRECIDGKRCARSIPHHVNVRAFDDTLLDACAFYIVKGKAPWFNSDIHGSKRVLFKPKTELGVQINKPATVGQFWADGMNRQKFWDDLKEREKAITETIQVDPRAQELTDHWQAIFPEGAVAHYFGKSNETRCFQRIVATGINDALFVQWCDTLETDSVFMPDGEPPANYVIHKRQSTQFDGEPCPEPIEPLPISPSFQEAVFMPDGEPPANYVIHKRQSTQFDGEADPLLSEKTQEIPEIIEPICKRARQVPVIPYKPRSDSDFP